MADDLRCEVLLRGLVRAAETAVQDRVPSWVPAFARPGKLSQEDVVALARACLAEVESLA